MLKIQVHKTFAPIPVDCADWCAITSDYDPDDPRYRQGFGATPESAVFDLIEQCEPEPQKWTVTIE